MKVIVSVDDAIDHKMRKMVYAASLGATLRRAGELCAIQPEMSISLKLTTDQELAMLNTSFLGEDHPTDVLAFPAEDPHYIGDIAISVERATLQATGTIQDELRLLAIHGFLHCIGYDHVTRSDASIMTQKTQFCLPNQKIPALEVHTGTDRDSQSKRSKKALP